LEYFLYLIVFVEENEYYNVPFLGEVYLAYSLTTLRNRTTIGTALYLEKHFRAVMLFYCVIARTTNFCQGKP